jgi:hypothetical protein
VALSRWDSEADTFIVKSEDVAVGSSVLKVLNDAIGGIALADQAKSLAVHFQKRSFHRVSSFMGGQSQLSQLLGVNEFAEPLFPVLTRYFGSNSDEIPDEVIDRAYVTSDEISTYDSVLETYLKDRTKRIAGNQI